MSLPLLTARIVSVPTAQGILDELRDKYPTAPVPVEADAAVRWLNKEIDEMLRFESNTKNHFNAQYLADLMTALDELHEARTYEGVGFHG